MRITTLLAPLVLAGPALAGLVGRDDSSTTSTRSSNSEVAFLQTLQAAKISSMNCLITLVNLTSTQVGTCLGLTTLADLIANPPVNQSFSTGLNTYLGEVCAQTCSDEDLADGIAQLDKSCSGQGNGLVGVLGTVMDNYSTSYRTLACQVHYNGTSDLCLPSVLNTSDTANTNTFFDALVLGNATTLEGYDSVFAQAQCTGCMYEMFKAAVYTTPAIRGQSLTTTFGDHLRDACPADPNTGSTVSWSDVEDEKIPDALQVSQNTQSSSAARRGARMGWAEWMGGVSGGEGGGMGGRVAVVAAVVLGAALGGVGAVAVGMR